VMQHVAAKTNLRAIAITDHDCIEGALQASKLAPHFGLEVIIGEEVSTADGHLLALFIHKHLPKGRPAKETIQAIHAQGGLAIAPHPFDHWVASLGKRNPRLEGWDLDGIEVFNAGVYRMERGCNRRAEQMARELRQPMLGNSDSHSLDTIGRGYTVCEGHTASDLYRAIQRNQTQWGGSYWRTMDHLGLWLRGMRQRGVREFVRWALTCSRPTMQAE
jgi:predicted metal-dependent phosphoesterase TrpH